MKIRLSKEQYNLLKKIDLSEIENDILLNDPNEIDLPEDKIRLLRIIITEEIDVNGLSDDQNEVTPYGRSLYDLHDTIYQLTGI